MSIKAKTVLKDKFWIVEQNGQNIGTLTANEDKLMLSSNEGIRFFDNVKHFEKKFGKCSFDIKETINTDVQKDVHGYPTSCQPFNPMFDIKRKLPLFTKSEKSKSIYCAGYYTIRFDKGWVKSFCPKQITIERYDYRGPFKTELEMRQEMSNVNR